MASFRPNTVERAYELARSGDFLTLTDLKARLAHEGYENVQGHLHGAVISAELKKLLKAADPGPDRLGQAAEGARP